MAEPDSKVVQFEGKVPPFQIGRVPDRELD